MNVTIFGNNSREGSYLLITELSRPVTLSFGRFRNGTRFDLPPGTYLYAGSALGATRKRANSSPLASRLLRHASGSPNRPRHAIHSELVTFFADRGCLPRGKAAEKKLHWHIDYLLDRPEATLSHIVMVMSPLRIEAQLAQLAGSLPGSSIIADRLGAQDSASGTHLFRIACTTELFRRLEASIPGMI